MICCYISEANTTMAWHSWPRWWDVTWSRRRWLDAAWSVWSGLWTSTTAWQVSILLSLYHNCDSIDRRTLKLKIAQFRLLKIQEIDTLKCFIFSSKCTKMRFPRPPSWI